VGVLCGANGFQCADGSVALPNEKTKRSPEYITQPSKEEERSMLLSSEIYLQPSKEEQMRSSSQPIGLQSHSSDRQRNLTTDTIKNQAVALLGVGTLCENEIVDCLSNPECALMFALGIRSLQIPLLYRLWSCL
jgi:hypothetical protein